MIKPITMIAVVSLMLCGCQNKSIDNGYIEIIYDSVVETSGPLNTAQLLVKQSVPVLPGTQVDIVTGDNPAHVLIAGAVVQSASWKFQGGPPIYPAEGFVTLSLSPNQWDSFLYKRDLRLFPHPKNQNN